MLAASIVAAAATVALAALAYWQIRAGRQQTLAALSIAREAREAAERQWQPRVFAHAWHGGPVRGDGDAAAPDEMTVPYYLTNAGTGPAFNVEHGIEVAGEQKTWDDRQWRTMAAGEEIPPLHDSIGMPVALKPIVIGISLDEWDDSELVYWTRFENLLGERFEVRNHPDPTRPAEFRRL
jgi:hypothetical protein